jgi:hypothetical protein
MNNDGNNESPIPVELLDQQCRTEFNILQGFFGHGRRGDQMKRVTNMLPAIIASGAELTFDQRRRVPGPMGYKIMKPLAQAIIRTQWNDIIENVKGVSISYAPGGKGHEKDCIIELDQLDEIEGYRRRATATLVNGVFHINPSETVETLGQASFQHDPRVIFTTVAQAVHYEIITPVYAQLGLDPVG